jgi:hypothetical protein
MSSKTGRLRDTHSEGKVNAKMRDKATKEFQEIQQAFSHISAHVRFPH